MTLARATMGPQLASAAPRDASRSVRRPSAEGPPTVRWNSTAEYQALISSGRWSS
jgi:hypothetical protein